MFEQITNDKLLVHVNETRFVRGFTALPIFLHPKLFNGRSADHHRHIFCVRQHPQDVLDGCKIIYSDRDNGVILGECGELNATFVHRREHHGGVGKELWSVTLDKDGRRRTDAYNEVRLLFSEERAEIGDERNLRVFIAGTGRHKRMVE